MRTPTCVTALDIASHGVQWGAANARCKLGRPRGPMHNNSVSKQHIELFHTDR